MQRKNAFKGATKSSETKKKNSKQEAEKRNPSKLQPETADHDSLFLSSHVFQASRCSEVLTYLSGEAPREAG